MPVRFNGNFIVPAPILSIQTKIERYEDGRCKKIKFSLTLSGKLTANMGDPKIPASGSFPSGNPYVNSERLYNTQYGQLYKMTSLQEKIRHLYELFDPSQKQEGGLNDALVQNFNNEGGELIVDGWDVPGGSQDKVIKTRCRVVDIDIPEGLWFETCDYKVILESEYLEIGDINNLKVFGSKEGEANIEETWSFEPDEDERYFKINRNITAQSEGRVVGETYKSGWILARDAVSGSLGNYGFVGTGTVGTNNSGLYAPTKFPYVTGSIADAGVFLFPNSTFDFYQGISSQTFDNFVTGSNNHYICYNPRRVTQIDKTAGKFTASETWSCANQNSFYDLSGLITNGIRSFALEDFNVSFGQNQESNLDDISIEGTIMGVKFFPTDGIKEKFNRAEQKLKSVFANNYGVIKERIRQRIDGLYSTGVYPTGYPLNRPVSVTVGKNAAAGTVTYNLKFANRDLPNTGLIASSGPSSLRNDTNLLNALSLVKMQNTTISDDGPSALTAENIVPNRGAGPQITALGATSKITRTINLELVFDKFPVGVTLPTTQKILESYNFLYNLWDSPSLSLNGPLFLDKINSNYNIETGKWNASITILSSN